MCDHIEVYSLRFLRRGAARLSVLLRSCRLFVADNYCRAPQSLQDTFRSLGKLPKLLEKLSIVSEYGINDFIIRRALFHVAFYYRNTRLHNTYAVIFRNNTGTTSSKDTLREK